MRVVQFSKIGDPEDVLTVVDKVIPNPAPGEVRVRLLARPINPSDLLYVEGLYGREPELPSPVGFEGAGVIDAVGEGVELSCGTRVIVDLMGTWQEYVVVKANSVILTPDELDDEVACQFTVNPLTAWLLLDDLDLTAGQWLLQTAGASMLGQLLIQLAKSRGIKTISTVRRAEHVELLRANGADEVIDTSVESVRERVLALTNGEGVSAALDAVGGDLGAQVIECLAYRGTMVVYGLLSGQDIPLSSSRLIFQALTIKSFWLPDRFEQIGSEAGRRVINNVLASLASGEMTPRVEARYDLADVRSAVSHARRSGRKGKIILIG